MSLNQSLDQLERLNAIGVALSAEQNTNRLLETILLGAQELTHADGGTLYTISEQQSLKFEILRNTTLNIALGGTTNQPIPFPPLPLYLDNGTPNLNMVAAYCAIQQTTINIEDAYAPDQGFDFSGTRAFDERTGYHSQSFLTVPMRNHENEVIGVLQLINAKDPVTHQIIAFSDSHQRLVESLASQAAIALTNHQLIEGLKGLFESFIKLIADAIDEKSPYTGGHCQRVPVLTMMLAEAAIQSKHDAFKSFDLNAQELYELKIAAWLHDCGKVTTPESIMDKATKLETIFDRIHLIDDRFELLKSQREANHLRKVIEAQAKGKTINPKHLAHEINVIKKQLDDDKNFIRKVNYGSESMSADDQARVRQIANYQYQNEAGQSVKFLSEDETYNLTIPKGTLTPEERQIINNHIVVTINMLESLPYPKGLRRVPEYAGGHHERMDGTGYPKGLTREQMSIPARIMGVADIFEALTSKDRPYKKAKTLSDTLNILGNMKLNHHIDPDVFDLFIREKIYLRYAEMFLDPEQIDAINESTIIGYTP
ncbi:MAG: HD domain-containing phosphohydrolase [Methylophilus sp.]|nr:HD domain-containing phosphohydrolase [Methylophilus sp.]